MAKAGRKSSTWLALRDACELMPFELLVRRLREGKARSRGLSKDGTVVEIPADFWGGLPVVDCNEGSARSRFLSPDLRFYRIEVLCEEALRPAERTAPLRTTQAKTIKGWQAKRVLRVLPKCFPPDGKVSDDTTTESVRQAVIAELENEARAAGQLKDKNSKLPNPPSWETVNRVLGRGK
jgi:hypothetical protein